MHRFLVVTLVLAYAPSALAQAVQVNPQLLRERTDTLYSYLVRGADTMFTGVVTDELSMRTIDGRRALHRVYSSESSLSGPSRDTIVDDATTMAPIRSASASGRGIERVRFDGGRARGLLRMTSGDSIPIDVALPSPVYSSSSFDLVLRASDLAEGWSTTIPSFVPSSRVVIPMTARVVTRERIDGLDCWRVDADFMGMSVTFWIEHETRALCRQEMRPQVGVSLLLTRYRPRAMRRDS